MTRWVLGVEYDGSCFGGFQRQSGQPRPTVQGQLEAALSRVAAEPIQLVCAGRTDAGVHATGQVVHFDSDSERSARDWVRGGNALTHEGICIHWARQVGAEFSARFSADWRRYLYLMTDAILPQTLLRDRVARVRGPLDAVAMDEAARFLLGEQDFTSFRAANCQSQHARREVQFVRVRRHGGLVGFEIQANAFLQHMVRNIVGSLLEVGRGQQSPGWIRELLAWQDRTRAGIAAPPEGLYLIQVGYAAGWGLPDQALDFPSILLG